MRDTEIIEITGHIIDSDILSKAIDEIVEAGAEYRILDFEVGKSHADTSRARIEVHAETGALEPLLGRLAALGASPAELRDARLVPAERDGVYPEGFYSTTSLPTNVRVDGRWLEVENPEMDCAIVIRDGHARTVAMTDIHASDMVVCGYDGVKVFPPEKPRAGDPFRFMTSDVSSEKPQGLLVQRIADAVQQVRKRGKKLLWVVGPAVVHTGSIEPFCSLIREGWVNVLFAGNALAAHDIEAAMFNTSLGVNLTEGRPIEHGHEHHLRAINAVRAAGSIKTAVERGLITRGIMWQCVQSEVDFVLAGSVRDDGPIPDVITDMVEAQRAMRARVPEIGLAVMVATMLHSIATSNVLPASTPIVCVDINPATVTKLMDRGSIQAVGMVTDVGLFLRQLAQTLGAS
jgi:lysine-ketoglutarate reductase/saccharopine dehydrogenase-like protein (TIGR00300 family)